MHHAVGKRYKELAPLIFQQHQQQGQLLGLPLAGYPIKDTIATRSRDENLSFTPQLVYTKQDQNGAFTNVAHYDNDASDFAFVLWIPLQKTDDCQALSDVVLDQVGGQFYNASYGWYLDFPNMGNVLVECLWQSAKQLHGTATSFYKPGTDRLGITAQVSQRLANAVRKTKSHSQIQ